MHLTISQGIKRGPQNDVTCPVCNNKLQLPVAAVEGLPNNLYVIHKIQVAMRRELDSKLCP